MRKWLLANFGGAMVVLFAVSCVHDVPPANAGKITFVKDGRGRADIVVEAFPKDVTAFVLGNDGKKAIDKSGNKHLVTRYGDVSMSSQPGEASVFNFSGASAFLYSSGPVMENNTVGFTIEAWLKTAAGCEGGAVMSGKDRCSTNIILKLDPSGVVVFETWSDKTDKLCGKSIVNDGKWHQVKAVFRRSEGKKIYIDGRLDIADATTRIAGRTEGWFIGKQSENSPTFFKGDMRDVRIDFNNYVTLARKAANELQDYLKKMSGAELEIIEVSGGSDKVMIANDKTHIYVGSSSCTRGLGLSAEGLKADGFRIVAMDNYLALLGRGGDKSNADDVELVGECGTLYAVRDFLKSLGVRWFAPGELGEVVPSLRDISCEYTDVRKEPDFEYRRCSGEFNDDPDGAKWYRRSGWGSSYFLFMNHSWHDFITRHQKDHPEFLALMKDGTRNTKKGNEGSICLTAPGILAQWVKDACEFFETHPGVMVYPIIPNDEMEYTQKWCHCPSCKALYDENGPACGDKWHGSHSYYVWSFVDKVAKEVAKSHPGKLIGCVAYDDYTFPPTKIERFSPNVCVMVAEVYKNRPFPWKRNGRYDPLALLSEWKDKGIQTLYVWDYYLYYDYKGNEFGFRDVHKTSVQGIPVVFTSAIARELRGLKNVSRGEFVEAGSRENADTKPLFAGNTSHALNLYVHGELLWDSSKDLNGILDDYFEKYYGPAKEEMRRFFLKAEELWIKPPGGKLDFDQMYTIQSVDELSLCLDLAKSKTPDGVYRKRVEKVIAETMPLIKRRH